MLCLCELEKCQDIAYVEVEWIQPYVDPREISYLKFNININGINNKIVF